MTITLSTQILNITRSWLYNHKKLNSVSTKYLTPEQIETLRSFHHSVYGYYPDSSFEARLQRVYNFIPQDFSVPDSRFSVNEFYYAILNEGLKHNAIGQEIIDRFKKGLPVTPEESVSCIETIKHSWELFRSVPGDFWEFDPKFWEAYACWDKTYYRYDMSIAKKIADWESYGGSLELFEAAEAEIFEPDTMFWQWVIFPECIISILIIFLLFTNVQKNRHFLVMLFWSFFALSANAIIRAALYPAPNYFFIDPFYMCDIYGSYVKAVFYFLISLYLLMLGSQATYNNTSEATKIHLISLLFLALFTSAVISSFDLFFFYIAIEGMSFSTIVMLVFSGKPKITVRAAIRYFCLNAFASGCLLFSIALLYGFCNHTSFVAFADITHNFVLMPNSFIALVIFFFIFVAFKLALFPLGAWLPSIYGQLDYATIYLFGIILKTVLFLVFFKLIVFSFFPLLEYFSNLCLGFGLLCLIFGSIGAFVQQDLKKFLALTSISHMGAMLTSMSLMDNIGFFSTFQYLGIYVVSSSVVFYCLSTTRVQLDHDHLEPVVLRSIPELRYLKEKSPYSAIALTIAFLSMAGAAPLAGLWAKISICLALMSEGQELVTIVFIVCSIISIFYYLQVLRALWFDSKNSTDSKVIVISGFDNAIFPEANVYIVGFLLSLVGYYFCYDAAAYHIYELMDSARCILSVTDLYPVKTTPTSEFADALGEWFEENAEYYDFWWLHLDDYLADILEGGNGIDGLDEIDDETTESDEKKDSDSNT